jgi:hypothetical protein
MLVLKKFLHNFLEVQISQKYGLIYLLTQKGLISIHDLKTAEAICSYNISDATIFRTTGGTISGSFYAINRCGQVLLTNVNDSTILSFLSGEVYVCRFASLFLVLYVVYITYFWLLYIYYYYCSL